MGREISLFADYHKKENSLTNYCGLLMKMLYEDSPRKFEELLATLLKTDTNIIVGPTFTQQTKTVKSIPDLAITRSEERRVGKGGDIDKRGVIQIDT